MQTAREGALALGFDLFGPYRAPFQVEVHSDDIVRIIDADGYALVDFNTLTQLPLGRVDLLALEKLFWIETATRIVDALNAAELVS